MSNTSDLPPLPPRPADGHKGLFGRVLIVGGNEQMLGAPVLAGTAALRMGAGLVQLAVPKSILAAALSVTPELIGLALGGTESEQELDEAARKADAIVLGPGLGQSGEAAERVHRLIRLNKPMVIDADALNLLAKGGVWPGDFAARAVLTPHPGEMSRLGALFGQTHVPNDEPGRNAIATKAAAAFGQTVILKGKGSVITDGRRVHINPTGDSSLSKAGAGDVLSGIIGTLLAEKMSPFDAACAGAWLHGRAGELAGQKLGLRCVLSRDVIDHLPGAIGEYERGP